jgi:hypothetical protein
MSAAADLRLGSFALAAALVVAASGCASYTTFKTAETLAPGRSQLLVAAQLQGAGTTDGVAAPMPELAVGLRRGMAERLELDATATLLPLGRALTVGSAEVAAKRLMWTSGDERWSLALGAGVGYRVTTSSDAVFEAVHASLPVSVGLALGRHQLVVSPTVGAQRWYSSGARPVDLPFAGASLGFRWQLGKRVALLPELTWAETSAKNFMTDTSRLFHLGVAVLVGGR